MVIGLFLVKPVFSIHLWKERSVAILRAMVASEYFLSLNSAKKPRMVSTSHANIRAVTLRPSMFALRDSIAAISTAMSNEIFPVAHSESAY